MKLSIKFALYVWNSYHTAVLHTRGSVAHSGQAAALPSRAPRMSAPQQSTQPGGVVLEHKKGEVNELKQSLRNPSLDRDPDKKREVIKRVIAYMTLGIDVSKLFSEMIMVGGSSPATLTRVILCEATSPEAADNPC